MDKTVNSTFRDRVFEIVVQIPKGRVMSFGQIATTCGKPRAARIVGGIAHYGDPGLPWQRVVKKDGSLAEGYYGGVVGHQADLEAEGIVFNNGKVPMSKYQWYPQ